MLADTVRETVKTAQRPAVSGGGWRERVCTSEGATALEREYMGGECRRDEVLGAG